MNTRMLAATAACVALLAAGAPAAEPLTDAFGDPLPERAVARIGTVRLRHARWVGDLAFSPDGKGLASAGQDGAVRLWDTGTGKLLHECRDPVHQPNAVVFAPDGKRLASADNSGRVFFWDPATGRQTSRFDAILHGDQLDAVTFTDRGKGVAVAGRMGNVLTHSTDGSRRHHFTVGFQPPFRPAFSADGTLVVTGGRGDTATVWDAATGTSLVRLTAAKAATQGAAFSPDGRYLAVGGSATYLWELATGQLVFTLPAPMQEALAFAPDGRALVSAGMDGKVHVWDMATGRERRQLRASGQVRVVAFSPDGKAVATGTHDGVIHLFDFATGKEKGPAAAVSAAPFAFTDGGKRLAVATPTALAFWEVAEPAKAGAAWTVREARRVETGAQPVALSPDGKLAAVGQSYDGVTLWDVDGGTELQKIGARDARGLAFSADGKLLLASSSGQPTAWDARTGKVVRQFERLTGREAVLALAPDGKTLAVAGGDRDNVLRLYDFASGKEQARVPIPSKREFGGAYRTVTFSPKGTTVAVADDGEGVRLYDVGGGRFVSTIAGGRVTAFSPDGKRLAAARYDGGIGIWNVATGKSVAELRGHGGAVTALCFSPDGRLLASGAADHTTLLWDLGKD